MNSQLTGKQKFWIFLAISYYLPFISYGSYVLDSRNFNWLWFFIYPIMSAGLLGFLHVPLFLLEVLLP